MKWVQGYGILSYSIVLLDRCMSEGISAVTPGSMYSPCTQRKTVIVVDGYPAEQGQEELEEIRSSFNDSSSLSKWLVHWNFILMRALASPSFS